MTIDKAKLRSLAQAVADLEDIPEREDEHAEAVDALWLNMHCHTILALLAEIERLEAQAKSRRSLHAAECVAMSEVQGELIDDRDQLKAENEALRKDAERYRWLRDECGVVAYKEIAGSIGPGMLPSGEKLEAAIDAAKERGACHV